MDKQLLDDGLALWGTEEPPEAFTHTGPAVALANALALDGPSPSPFVLEALGAVAAALRRGGAALEALDRTRTALEEARKDIRQAETERDAARQGKADARNRWQYLEAERDAALAAHDLMKAARDEALSEGEALERRATEAERQAALGGERLTAYRKAAARFTWGDVRLGGDHFRALFNAYCADLEA